MTKHTPGPWHIAEYGMNKDGTPKLLEALKEALQDILDLSSRLEDHEDTGDYTLIVDKARAAIAKATGEEE